MNKEETLTQLAKYIESPQACNFREEDGYLCWTCDNGKKHIISWMKAHNIERLPIPNYFCDCEVVFNLEVLLQEDAEESYSSVHIKSEKESGRGEVGKDDWMVSLATLEESSKQARDAADRWWLYIQTKAYRMPDAFKDAPFSKFATALADKVFDDHQKWLDRNAERENKPKLSIDYEAFTDTFAKQLRMWQQKETLPDRTTFNDMLGGIKIDL